MNNEQLHDIVWNQLRGQFCEQIDQFREGIYDQSCKHATDQVCRLVRTGVYYKVRDDLWTNFITI